MMLATTRALRALLLVTVVECGTTDLSGEPDSSVDPAAEDPSAEDTAEPEPTCWDRDGDRHMDKACGGDDCNDGCASCHPGASEICLDGQDNDCDGIIDGLKLMRDPLQFSDTPDDHVFIDRRNLAWTGSEFVTDGASATFDYSDWSIYLARIDAEASHVIERVPMDDFYTCLAWSGSQFGELSSSINGRSINFRLLDPQGHSLTDPIPIHSTEGTTSYLVPLGTAWLDGGFSLFYMLNEDGPEGGLKGIWHSGRLPSGDRATYPFEIIGGDGHDKSLAGADLYEDRMMVTYRHSQSEGIDHVYLLMFDPETREVEFPITLVASAQIVRRVTSAWSGSRMAVTWTGDHDVHIYNAYISLFDASFSRVLDDRELSPSGSSNPSLLWTGSEFFIGFTTRSDPDPAVLHFVTMSQEGGIGDPGLTIEMERDGDVSTLMTWTGSEIGVSWDAFTDGFEGYLARIGFCE